MGAQMDPGDSTNRWILHRNQSGLNYYRTLNLEGPRDENYMSIVGETVTKAICSYYCPSDVPCEYLLMFSQPDI